MNEKELNTDKDPSKITNSFFSESVRMTGILSIDGNMRMDGEYKGKIQSVGSVLLGNQAKIEGELECDSLICGGEISGIVSVAGEISLKSTAVVKGEITTAEISIEDEVVFEADCRIKNPKNIKKKNVPLIRKFRKAIPHR